jgi:hypothetical protein
MNGEHKLHPAYFTLADWPRTSRTIHRHVCISNNEDPVVFSLTCYFRDANNQTGALTWIRSWINNRIRRAIQPNAIFGNIQSVRFGYENSPISSTWSNHLIIATTAVLFVYGDWLFGKYRQFPSLWYLGLHSSSLKRIGTHKSMYLTLTHVLCTNKHKPPSEFRTCLLNLLCHGGNFEENSYASGQHEVQYTE